MRAVAQANPIQPRNATMRVASLSEMVKPAWVVKKQVSAIIQLSGVAGNSAYRERDQEPGRPYNAGSRTSAPERGINNTYCCIVGSRMGS